MFFKRTSKMGKILWLPLVMVVVFFMMQCPTASKLASKVIRSNESGIVEHPSGASLTVPLGAVAKTATGSEGEMVFTIEDGSPESFGLPSTPPASDMEALGSAYQMGPSGFIFAEPVTVTLPLPSGFDFAHNKPVIGCYNYSAGKWEVVGGVVNDAGTAIATAVRHFSEFQAFGNPMSNEEASKKMAGLIKFSLPMEWRGSACIKSYILAYPDFDADFDASQAHCYIPSLQDDAIPPTLDMGWGLPQGTYTI